MTSATATNEANRSKSADSLEAYFERIGYAGEKTPTLGALQNIVLRHTETIAFENLNPLLGLPVRLDARSVEEKLVRQRRGGYCFEQNLLLKDGLEALGFRVRGLGARVLWNQPPATVTARTHMLLLVEIGEESYLVDVGFGGLTLTGVLRLEAETEQSTPHEPFRLKGEGNDFLMQAQVGGEWKSLYRFDLHEQLLPDYEVTSWYLSNNPNSHFTNTLIAARQAAGVRYALRNDAFSVHYLHGKTEKRTLAAAAEIMEILETVFLLDLPEPDKLNAALAKILAR